MEDGVILLDRGGFLEGELARIRERMRELGSVRVKSKRGRGRFWILKPDIRTGEVVEI